MTRRVHVRIRNVIVHAGNTGRDRQRFIDDVSVAIASNMRGESLEHQSPTEADTRSTVDRIGEAVSAAVRLTVATVWRR